MWDARLRRPSKCPNCSEQLIYDEVDVGVGFVSSPAWCDNPECGYCEEVGLCEPDGRAPVSEVPKIDDLTKLWDRLREQLGEPI